MIKEVNSKIKNNAISAYLMVFISWLLLFNKTNSYINNDFVKSHIKSATIVHIAFIVTYIIFISNSFGSNIDILGIGLNNIIANIIFIFFLLILIFGIYKSSKGEYFHLGKSINIAKTEKIIDINGDGNISEKDKLTILLSFIPFIGFLNYGKYRKNKIIQSSNKINTIITLIIILLLVSGYTSLSSLLLLLYIIIIVFIGISLFTKNELIQIKIPESLGMEQFYLNIVSFIKYTKNYIGNKPFIEFKKISNDTQKKYYELEVKEEVVLKNKKSIKLNNLIYIPFLSIIFLFFKDTKYRFHIINANVITFIILVLIVSSIFININSYIYLLFLFPISYGAGNIKYRLAYKIPFVYDLYLFFIKIVNVLSFGTRVINKKRKEEKSETLKIK